MKSTGKIIALAISLLVIACFVGFGVSLFYKSTKGKAFEQPPVVTEPTSTIPTVDALMANKYLHTSLRMDVALPDGYSFSTSTELHRAGSIVSYDFHQAGGIHETPDLQEILFFSEDSIKDFEKGCVGADFCFEGNFPTLTSYREKKVAFQAGKDYGDSLLRKFGDRYWFVSNSGSAGDRSVETRGYTTFEGDIEIDVSITMLRNRLEDEQADALFSQIELK